MTIIISVLIGLGLGYGFHDKIKEIKDKVIVSIKEKI